MYKRWHLIHITTSSKASDLLKCMCIRVGPVGYAPVFQSKALISAPDCSDLRGEHNQQ